MWQCPKCGRAFKNQNQGHFCGEPPITIDAYISAQPEGVQPKLNQVRNAIRAALPEAQERISWSMPTYWLGRNIIHFAAFKNHIGLYPGEEAVEYFGECLKDYKPTKGAIKFPYAQPLPLELIVEIALWCYKKGNRH